jgi:hypothetical protein
MNEMKNTMKKVILLLVCCVVPFSFYAQKARQNGITKKWGYERTENKDGWWKNSKYRGNSMLDKWDAALVNQDYEINWLISPQYEEVTKTFTEKLAGVVLGGKVGFIDMHNRFIIKPQFENVDDVHGFNLGLSAVKKNGKFGFINKKGEFVIEPQFDYADNFRDNMLATVKQDGKFGAINIRGEVVVPCKYILEEAMISVPISNKLYRQKQEEMKDAKGNGDFDDVLDKITECSREVNERINNLETEIVTDSLQIEEKNGKMCLLVGEQTIIPAEYEELIISEDGFILACKQDKWGALDVYGRIVLPCVYQWVYYDASAKVFIASSFAMGLYNSQGALLLPGRFDYIGSFADGKAPVWLNSVLGWVDEKGHLSDGFVEDLTKSFLEEEEKGIEGAWGMFNLLIDLKPDYAMAHYYMGKGQVTGGIYSKGMEHLKIAAELDPDNEEIASTLKQAKKDRKKRTFNTIGYIANVHNNLESTNSNSFKDKNKNQDKTSVGINLGLSMDDMDALGGSTATAIAGGSNRCGFLKYVLEDLEKKIRKNTGKLMGEYYQKIKDGFLQSASKEGCEQ